MGLCSCLALFLYQDSRTKLSEEQPYPANLTKSKPKSEPNTGWPLGGPPEHRQFLQIFETFDVAGKKNFPISERTLGKKHTVSFVLIRTILVNTSHVKAFISETPMGVDETSMKEHVTNLIRVVCVWLQSYCHVSTVSETALI